MTTQASVKVEFIQYHQPALQDGEYQITVTETIEDKNSLVRKVGDDDSDLGVINAKHFSLVTNGIIPSKKAHIQGVSLDDNNINTGFGIDSMAVSDLTTKQAIAITKDDFKYIPILKKVPAGLWGNSLTPELNGEKFIDNALSGFEIQPGGTPDPAQRRR